MAGGGETARVPVESPRVRVFGSPVARGREVRRGRVAEPQSKKQNRQASKRTEYCGVARARGLACCRWRWGRDAQEAGPRVQPGSACTSAVRRRERNYSASGASIREESSLREPRKLGAIHRQFSNC
jgi:hypothetical protein